MGRKLFVSYSRNDQGEVATLIEDLEGFDHTAWMDKELTGGQDWWSEVLSQIRACDLFIFSVSHDSVTSEACLREYEYASRLGKPVLPVTVRRGAADALLPESLGHIQRVDYSDPDRASMTRLIRAIDAMPEAGPLPDDLPDEPEIPATYLYDLNKEIGDADEMTPAKQDEIIAQLRHQADAGDTPVALKHMIEKMRRRNDLLVRSSEALSEIEASLPTEAPGTEEPPAQSPSQDPVHEPPASPPPPSEAASGERQPSASTQQQPTPPQTVQPAGTGQVHGAWWVAPILFALLGGFVAWLVNKDVDPRTARNMLITGVVMTFVWAIFGGGL